MYRIFALFIFGAAALMLASCGAPAEADRVPSARGIIVAKPGTSAGRAGAPCTIYFYDAGSSSSNGPIVKYEWNFGDGWEDATATEGLAAHKFDVPGTVNAHLRVTDSTGKKDNAKVKVIVESGFDAEPVTIVLGADESDETGIGPDGKELRYHKWRWRCLAYDPEDSRYGASHTLSISPGDPDFDLLCVFSEGSEKDFVLGDLDGDGVDDDASVKRTFVLPHVLEVSGRCIGRAKQDVYVWKVKSTDTFGKTKELKGHVTLIK